MQAPVPMPPAKKSNAPLLFGFIALVAVIAIIVAVVVVIKPGSSPSTSPTATGVAQASTKPFVPATPAATQSGQTQGTSTPAQPTPADQTPADQTSAPTDEPSQVTIPGSSFSIGLPSSAPVAVNPGSDPAATAQSFVAAVSSKNWDQAMSNVCTDSQSSVRLDFDPSQAMSFGSAMLGVSGAQFLSIFNVEYTDLKAAAPVVSGDSATVAVTGSEKISIDTAKLKQLLQAQGTAVDDATLNMMMAAMGASVNQDTPVNQTLDLQKQDNGGWLICQ